MPPKFVAVLLRAAVSQGADAPKCWTADNGNGTYSNPLFNDEFSDPDMIRVGTDYYLTGATMLHPVLASRERKCFGRKRRNPNDKRVELVIGCEASDMTYHAAWRYLPATLDVKLGRVAGPRKDFKENAT
jgi:hypothetical protein